MKASGCLSWIFNRTLDIRVADLESSFSMAIDEISQTQVPNLLKKLRNFLGGRAADRALRAYERSLASSGPLYRAYYIAKRHPWWNDWLIYNQKEREGRSLANRLSPGVQKIAADAHKIAVLQRDMPEPVKKKYRGNLLADQAAPHLFELEVAWHYRILGCAIRWCHSDSSPVPDFGVTHPQIDFDVECCSSSE